MTLSRLVGVCAVLVSGAAHGGITFTPLDHLDGFDSAWGFDLSDDGSVVIGLAKDPTEGGFDERPVRWEHGVLSVQPTSLSGPTGELRAMSADGMVAVGTQATGATHPLRVESGVPDDLGFGIAQPTDTGSAVAISADGSTISVLGFSSGVFKSFVWQDDVFTEIVAPDASVTRVTAKGISGDGTTTVGAILRDGPTPGPTAFAWSEGVLTELDDLVGGVVSAQAAGASWDGSIIAGHSHGIGGSEAVRWVNGALETLGGFGAGYGESVSTATSNDGSVVIGSVVTPIGEEGFYWSEAGGFRLLSTMLTDAGIDLAGWQLRDVLGLTGDGRKLTGYGINPSGREQAFVITVPAPTSSGLLGLVLIPSFRRQRAQGG